MNLPKHVVSIAKNDNIEKAVIEGLDHIEIPDLNGKKVLLKPNVGREVDTKLAINTNPDVVSAVFHYLNERYDAEFYIGDSPIINTDTKIAFEKSGFGPLLREKDLTYINLDDKPPILKEIPKGQILKKINVSGYYDEMDVIISIPVLKMHMHTGATLSFKNMKGLLYKRNKISLHHHQNPAIVEKYRNSIEKVKELDIAISDLSHFMRPDISIIDASFVMEGMGPSAGNKIKMDTIIASTNFLAADIIALALTRPDWRLQDVPHLKLISEIIPGAPTTIKDCITIPEDLSAFETYLEPPPESVTIKYENVRLISEQACSACLSTVFNLIENNKELINAHFTKEKPLTLAIGKGLDPSNLYEEAFLIGNCTANVRTSGVFIKGCTPVESKIIQIIKESLKLE